jgi:hypothetical protein
MAVVWLASVRLVHCQRIPVIEADGADMGAATGAGVAAGAQAAIAVITARLRVIKRHSERRL